MRKKEMFKGFPDGVTVDFDGGQTTAEWNLPVNGGLSYVYARVSFSLGKFYELVIGGKKYTESECDKIVYIEFIPNEGKIVINRRQ